MTFPNHFYAYLANHTLVEIRGGVERDRFLPIWMVAVDGRVFARSGIACFRSIAVKPF